MKPKHTPGPWFIDETWQTAVQSKDKHIAMVNFHKDDTARSVFGLEHMANAKLIAAAPELLEALQSILDIGKRDMSNPKYDAYFSTAKEAIKKAIT